MVTKYSLLRSEKGKPRNAASVTL
jgi:predicted nucleic acid-binding Zn ribbon protein